MAGITDCIMSFRKWQKLMAVRTRKAMPALRRGGASATAVMVVCADIF
jgi:hypothetical protein